MCCLSCSCAFEWQLVSVPALGVVRVLVREQHLLLRLLLLPSALPSAAVSVEGLLMQFHVEAPALPVVKDRHAIRARLRSLKPYKLQHHYCGIYGCLDGSASFFQNNVRHTVKIWVWYSKHFKAFPIHHTSPIKSMYIHWVFPIQNMAVKDTYVYVCIYIYIM